MMDIYLLVALSNFSDNPNVDIVGANLYDRYLKKMWSNRENGNSDEESDTLPNCRTIPTNVSLRRQSVRSMESVLVGTGVFNLEKESKKSKEEEEVYHGHRDILHEPELAKPSRFVPDVCHGIQYILEQENFMAKAIPS